MPANPLFYFEGVHLDSRIKDVEQRFEEAHLEYLNSTADKTKSVKYLMRRDKQMSHEFERHWRMVERLNYSIERWKFKLEFLIKQNKLRNDSLEDEKNAIHRSFHLLKVALSLLYSCCSGDLTVRNCFACVLASCR